MPAVSIVCVFNDPDVRAACLDRSIDMHRDEVGTVEYLPIDNTAGQFATAGSALNHGARQASNDYVAFVHQDVFLHSLRSLEDAADILAHEASLGLIGAVGVTSDGRVLGQIRDRVVMLGEQVTDFAQVDSLDEVLFMTRRSQVLEEPLSEDPELAWHAYAVEYGLRLRRRHLSTAATQIPLTHNSLTINLARLDVAHRHVATRYPEYCPTRTTCGVVGAPRRPLTKSRVLSRYRWRYPWLRESLIARRLLRSGWDGDVVLADIRRDVDEVIDRIAGPLQVVNVQTGARSYVGYDPIELSRRGRSIVVSAITEDRIADVVADCDPETGVLVTNVPPESLARLASLVPVDRRRLGFHENIGCWLLLGAAAAVDIRKWNAPRAVPLRTRRSPRDPAGAARDLPLR
jgi:hypothetical protein